MNKLIKQMLLQSLCCLILVGLVFFLTKSYILSFFLFLISSLLILIKPIFRLINYLIKRTNWYKFEVGDGLKFQKQIPFNLDICNLGSNSGKYAFLYENTGLKGENWAIGPQSLSYDFKVLKNNCSYLKEGATVLITLCPFSFCLTNFKDDNSNYKYYSFLHPFYILGYSPNIKDKVMRFIYNPFLYSPLNSLKRLVKDIPDPEDQKMDEKDLDIDADNFVSNWKKQFSISDLDAPVSEQNNENIIYNSCLLKEMIDFCLERDLKPVIVIPPVYKTLSSKFSEKFKENYLYSIVRNVNSKKIPFINYFECEKFSSKDLFFRAFFLNVKGRKIFTNSIINELHLLE